MKNIKFLSVLCAILFSVTTLWSQQITDLRINEMLIKNDSNLVDEYGRHTPWIEIFNTSYNSVNIAGCFLTDDTTGLAAGKGSDKWYRIPQGDSKTLIPQRGHILFYLDDEPLYGTFHANFNPANSNTNYVALISSNAKTLIHIFHYPNELKLSDNSFGAKVDGGEEYSFLDYFTPGSTNKVELDVTKSEKLTRDDPYGIGLAVISMAVVFSVLVLIFLMLKAFGLINKFSNREKNQAPKAAKVSKNTKEVTPEELAAITTALHRSGAGNKNGEEIAAIATALYLHLDTAHDEESEVITIEMQNATYSPWAQKHLTIKRVQRR